jgi:hypothetical protein
VIERSPDLEPTNLTDDSPAARAVVRELQIVSDTLGYLSGIQSHLRSQLRGVLAAAGKKSSQKIARGVTIKLVPTYEVVCVCHHLAPGACPAAENDEAVRIEEICTGDRLAIEYDATYIKMIPAAYDPAPAELPRPTTAPAPPVAA